MSEQRAADAPKAVNPNWDKHPNKGWTATLPPRRMTLIGMAVRAWCERTHTSQSKLAERLDVDHSYISRIAAGNRVPNQDFALRIADEIGIPRADMALMLCDIDPTSYRQEIEQATRETIVLAVTTAMEATDGR